MEFKDVIGLVFTLVFLFAFQFLSRPKKKTDQHQGQRTPPPLQQKKKETRVHKQYNNQASVQTPPLSSSQQKYAKQISNTQAYVLDKPKQKTKIHSLFQDHHSLKKAFIMQEILKKPYE